MWEHRFGEECKTRMENKIGDTARIKTITRPRKRSIARDIIHSTEEGIYDAVIIGRRGITGLQELIMGSVTSNLLSGSKIVPIWVVDGQVSSNGILIAVDGSPGSLKAVDHVAHMLSESGVMDIGIVNIQPKLGEFCEVLPESNSTEALSKAILKSNEKCMADFIQKANVIFEKAGIEKKTVKYFDIKQKYFTGKAILDTFKKSDYNTLVVGKTGFGQSPDMGRVCTYLVQKISGGVVWVVP